MTRTEAIEHARTKILAALQERPLALRNMYAACGLDRSVRFEGTSAERILDAALQGLRKRGAVQYGSDRKWRAT